MIGNESYSKKISGKRNHGGSLMLLKEELVERLWRF
jgi:hypothetical protein